VFSRNFLGQVPVKTVREKLYVRLSVHIYNTEEQYLELARAINALRAEHIASTTEHGVKRECNKG
jgi:selenocysteine lyase/cysteine desulfurase